MDFLDCMGGRNAMQMSCRDSYATMHIAAWGICKSKTINNNSLLHKLTLFHYNLPAKQFVLLMEMAEVLNAHK